MKEIWQEGKGKLEGYSFSNLGKVRSKSGVDIKPFYLNKKKFFKVRRMGYNSIEMARAILRAFTNEKGVGMEVCYIDGNTDNIALDNLKWVLPNPKDKKEVRIKEIMDYIEEGNSLTSLTKEYQISAPTVRKLLRSKGTNLTKLRNEKARMYGVTTSKPDNEIWVNISEHLSVSNHGRVKDLITNKLVKISTHGRVTISNSKDNSGTIYVKHLVSIAFLPNELNHLAVINLDGDITNNSLENVVYSTVSAIKDNTRVMVCLM